MPGNGKLCFSMCMPACLPTSVFDRVGVLTALLCVRYAIVLRRCLVVVKLILLFSFYVCSNAYTFFHYSVTYFCTIFVLNKYRWVSARGDEAFRRSDEPQLARLLPEPQRLRLAFCDDAGTSHKTGRQPISSNSRSA